MRDKPKLFTLTQETDALSSLLALADKRAGRLAPAPAAGPPKRNGRGPTRRN